MGANKEIGKAFRTKINDFSHTPNNLVWTKIEESLKQKKKKRVIALWFWFSIGLLIISLTTFILIKDTFNKESIDNSSKESFNNTKPAIFKKDSTLTTNKLTTKEKPVITYKNNRPKNNVNIKKSTDSKPKLAIVKKASAAHNNPNQYKQQSNMSRVENKTTISKDVEIIAKSKNQIGKVKDSTAVKKSKEIKLEKKKAKQVQKPKEIKSKLSLTAAVIPTTYQFIGNSSTLSQRLINNDKKTKVSLNYGIYLNNHFSKKWAYRTGILKTSINYLTKDVSTKNTDGTTKPISSISQIKPSTTNTYNGNINDFLDASDYVNIGQKINYLEIPLELMYKVGANKITYNFIGGVSFLVTYKNTVNGFSNQYNNLELGTVINLSKINMSTNVGLGMGYELNQDFNLSLNGLFKYHLNGFDNSFGKVKPYSLGLQFGLNYKLD